MKTVPVILILAIAMAFSFSSHGQGFINLDFESAYNLPANPPEPNGVRVAVTNALPGWTAYNGDVAYSGIYYVSNYISGASTAVELAGGSVALSGNFSVGLYGANGSISQTGQVPESAESLEFEAQETGAIGSIQGADLSVTLGGQTLPYSLISEGSSYSIYGANIPVSMDGQNESLIFSVGFGNLLLDNIPFLPTVVPEPSGWALIGLWASAFGFWRGKRIYLDRTGKIV
jgi:hypothetical protein